MAPGVVSSGRPVSSCHAGEVWVKRNRSAFVPSVSITAVAAGRFTLGKGGEVEVDDGFEGGRRRAGAEAFGECREPIGIRCLKRQQLVDRIAPALRTACGFRPS